MMHLYQALEYDYFLLKENDTVLVSYNMDERPELTSLTSERNTALYNLPYSIPEAIQHKGYYIETVLFDYYFQKADEYFKNRRNLQNPDLDDFLSPIYVDLDSLSTVYERYLGSIAVTLDSLWHSRNIDSEYYNYYCHRLLPEHRYTPVEIVQSDSLLHYISHYITAQQYCKGQNTLESFDQIASDTVATTLAKNGILKRLINNIISGESGWHIYPEDVVSSYLGRYTELTGDSTPGQSVEKNNVSPGCYDLPLETEDGKATSLDDVLRQYKGNLVYMDFWASWCAPCLAQIPFSKELKQKFSNRDIRFVYISVDKDRESWKRKVEDNNELLKGSYRITQLDAGFLKDIRLERIPRYLIFDRQGKLINPDAMRPSEDGIERELLLLLDSQ